VLAHGVHLSDADMVLAARRGVTLVTNPGSNRRLYNGTARLAAMLQKGLRVAIGSDNSAFNDDEDLLSELRLAGILARSPDWNAPPAPGAAELLAMATLAGAAAARFDGEIGRLAPGWRADLVAVSLARIRGAYLDPDMPLPDALVFRGRGHDVRLTMVDGRVCYRDGVFPHLDPDAIPTAAAETARAARRPRDPGDVESARRLQEHLQAFLATER
jgi:cytosine/adenosine deaminase-related metal-dependent hydrolase